MKEIEILVRVNDNLAAVKKKLAKIDYLGVNRVVDEYYYDPLRSNLKPNEKGEINECLRVRRSNNNYSITYKDDVFSDGKWLYSNEYESNIDNVDSIKEILKHIGFKKLLEIDNTKEKYQANDYEIVVENVKDLGIFMEVEYCTNDDVSVKDIKKEIQTFIDNLDIDVSEELNIGKPEMMIKLKNIKVD